MAKLRNPKLTGRLTILSLILALAMGLGGCNTASSLLLREPQPEVIKTEASESAIGLDYAIILTADVVNYGYSGDVRVTGHLWYGDDHWIKTQVIYIPKDAHREVQLIFKEATLFGSLSGYKYKVVAEPL